MEENNWISVDERLPEHSQGEEFGISIDVEVMAGSPSEDGTGIPDCFVVQDSQSKYNGRWFFRNICEEHEVQRWQLEGITHWRYIKEQTHDAV